MPPLGIFTNSPARYLTAEAAGEENALKIMVKRLMEGAPTFYFYITDYQGNNRGVLNASSGTLDQITHYYPWGSPYADLGKGADFQPYKFSDKELSTFAGVSHYDFAARTLFPAIPRFDRPDPLAGKYPHISPYSFCANNPVNFTDPTGMDWVSGVYESDTFYFWDDRVKNKEDITKHYSDLERVKYIGKTHTTTKDGKEITLSDGGHFSVNGHSPEGEYNSNGLHVGRSSMLQKDDKGNPIYPNNRYGHYTGDKNPKLADGSDSYAIPPINELDYAAFKHDLGYDAHNVAGPLGVLSPITVLEDMRLTYDAVNYTIHSTNASLKDRGWGVAVSTLFGISSIGKAAAVVTLPFSSLLIHKITEPYIK